MPTKTIPGTQEYASVAPIVARRPRIFTLACMVTVAAVLHLAAVLPRLHDQFDTQEHSWVAAHFMMMAHNFANDGVIKLRAVPIQNYAPQGTQPDTYIHWPPLFPVTLAAAFRLLGESEASARILMLLIAAAQAFALYFLGRSLGSVRLGLYIAFWWMTLPMSATFVPFVIHLNLAILFLILSLIAFLRAREGEELHRPWAAAGCSAMTLAVLSSWEPILICPGLLLASWLMGKKRDACLALLYLMAGTLAISAVFVLFLAQNPANLGELKETVLFRLGVRTQLPTVQPLHSLPTQWEYQISHFLSAAQWFEAISYYARTSFGFIPILAASTGLVALSRQWRRKPRTVVAVAGLLSAPCAWYVTMRNHVFQHRYEMLLFAPAVALLSAYSSERLESFLENRFHSSLKILIAPLIAFLMLMPLAESTREAQFPPLLTEQVDYAEAVERTTPASAVVITPARSLVPVYYSHRHMIRVVNSDDRVEFVLPRIQAIFPGAPVYLAIPPYSHGYFPRTLSRSKVVHRENKLLVVQLSDR